MKSKQTTEKPEAAKTNAESVRSSDLLGELSAEAKLMRAAARFAIAFDENRSWGAEFKRLDYTLAAWRDLAMAAVEFATVNSPNND